MTRARLTGRRRLLGVALLLAVVELATVFYLYSPCASPASGADGVTNRWCYNDISLLHAHRGGTFPSLPYRDYILEYPAGTAVFVTLISAAAARWHHLTGVTDTATYHTMTLLVLALLTLTVVTLVHGMAGARAAFVLVLMPTFAVAAFVNWDLLAVAALIGALWAWHKNQPAMAGVLIGIGTATKLFPVLLLWPLFLLAWRVKDFRPFAAVTGWAAAAWLAINLPLLLSPAFRDGWWLFYQFSADRRPEPGTVWYLVGYQPSGRVVGLFFIAAMLAVGWVALQADAIPRLATLAFLAVSAFLLTSKVWSFQYVWWVLPLAVIAGLSTRMVIVWQLADFFYYLEIWNLLGIGDPTVMYTISTGFRWLTLAGLCLLAFRQVLAPSERPDRLAPPEASSR